MGKIRPDTNFKKMRRLGREFYLQPTLQVAQELLGKYLVRKDGEKKIIGKIVETEAYKGPGDKTSHSFGGKVTKRNLAEYMTGGHIYIYLIYGMYWQLNITTVEEGKPECVLIRALQPVTGTGPNDKPASGPGKLCQWMKLGKWCYGLDLVKSNRLWLEDGEEPIKKSQIVTRKRIGIDYAGEYWANKKWRFYIRNNPFVSRK